MKYLLDTIVVSETWKPRPDPVVRSWLEKHGEDCGVPAPVLAEIADGIYATSGERRDTLLQRLNQFLTGWADNIVAWDALAAIEWGKHSRSCFDSRHLAARLTPATRPGRSVEGGL
ncbi:MAG: hypothetical protein ACR2OZ_19410 [Verrucomicrobiales bacterium]